MEKRTKERSPFAKRLKEKIAMRTSGSATPVVMSELGISLARIFIENLEYFGNDMIG
jgi:hypothetical protein